MVKDPDEAEEPPPIPWRLMGRYLGQRSPSAETLKNHFASVWRLRMGVHFSEIKPKFFVITRYSKGDYDFIVEGGPWIHLGNGLMVKKLDGNAKPSELGSNV